MNEMVENSQTQFIIEIPAKNDRKYGTKWPKDEKLMAINRPKTTKKRSQQL
jgi:hypothetical protein